jgi:hypothetical protein
MMSGLLLGVVLSVLLLLLLLLVVVVVVVVAAAMSQARIVRSNSSLLVGTAEVSVTVLQHNVN